MIRPNVLRVYELAPGDKCVSVQSLLDELGERVRLLEKEICTPGKPQIETELVRGQRYEVTLIQKALKELVPRA